MGDTLAERFGSLRGAVRLGLSYAEVVGRLAPGVLVALEFGLIVDLDGARSRIHEAYEGMLRRNAPTDPPDLLVERAVFTDTADLRRFARHARTAARRATAMQGM